MSWRAARPRVADDAPLRAPSRLQRGDHAGKWPRRRRTKIVPTQHSAGRVHPVRGGARRCALSRLRHPDGVAATNARRRRVKRCPTCPPGLRRRPYWRKPRAAQHRRACAACTGCRLVPRPASTSRPIRSDARSSTALRPSPSTAQGASSAPSAFCRLGAGYSPSTRVQRRRGGRRCRAGGPAA